MMRSPRRRRPPQPPPPASAVTLSRHEEEEGDVYVKDPSRAAELLDWVTRLTPYWEQFQQEYQRRYEKATEEEETSLAAPATLHPWMWLLYDADLQEFLNHLCTDSILPILRALWKLSSTPPEHLWSRVLIHFLDCALASHQRDIDWAGAAVMTLTAYVAVRSCQLGLPVTLLITEGSDAGAADPEPDSTPNQNHDSLPALSIDRVWQQVLTMTTVLSERVRRVACLALAAWVWAWRQSEVSPQRPFWLQHRETALDQASQALLVRITDKHAAVRLAAIQASAAFFYGSNAEDDPDLRTALLWALQHDPVAANRIAAWHSLPLNLSTVDFGVARARDVDSAVRVAVLQQFQRQAPSYLSTHKAASADDEEEFDQDTTVLPGHLAALVQVGLTERCVATKQATQSMICQGWLPALDYCPLALLRRLGVLEHEKAAQAALISILEALHPQSTIPCTSTQLLNIKHGLQKSMQSIVIDGEKNSAESLTMEGLFLARIVCQKANTPEERDMWWNRVIHDVPALGQALERRTVALIGAIQEADSTQEERLTFQCLQLLELAKLTDLEEGSRRHLNALLRRMLSNVLTPEDLLEGCVQTLYHVGHGRTQEFLLIMVDDIAEHLRQQAETQPELALNCQLRVLSLLNLAFQVISQSPLMDQNSGEDWTFVHVMQGYILSSFTDSNRLVREASTSALGKWAVLCELPVLATQTAEVTSVDRKRFQSELLQAATSPDECLEVRAQALMSMADLASLKCRRPRIPPALAPSDDENATSLDSASWFPDELVQLVGQWLSHEEPRVRGIAAEIAAKLLFVSLSLLSNRRAAVIAMDNHPDWIAHLLHVFFETAGSADAEEEDLELGGDGLQQVGDPQRLQQLLSLFFPAYCGKGRLGCDSMLASLRPLQDLVNRRDLVVTASDQPKKSRSRLAQTSGRHKAAATKLLSKINDYVHEVVDQAH